MAPHLVAALLVEVVAVSTKRYFVTRRACSAQEGRLSRRQKGDLVCCLFTFLVPRFEEEADPRGCLVVQCKRTHDKRHLQLKGNISKRPEDVRSSLISHLHLRLDGLRSSSSPPENRKGVLYTICEPEECVLGAGAPSLHDTWRVQHKPITGTLRLPRQLGAGQSNVFPPS